MKTLVVGATGATGRLLVEQLLNRGQDVKVVVRYRDKMLNAVSNHDRLSVVLASVAELSDAEMVEHVQGCGAVASCLGHGMTFKGIYGSPRRLVADTTRRLCDAIKANKPKTPVKFVLMNTAGNSNRDLNERVSFGQKCAVGLIRLLLPPHVDNEQAADYLRTRVGQNNQFIEWVVVRPDNLLNENVVSEYELHPSPTRSAIFDAGKTSRINVADFMYDLITDNAVWNQWKGQMPVIYNRVAEQPSS